MGRGAATHFVRNHHEQDERMPVETSKFSFFRIYFWLLESPKINKKKKEIEENSEESAGGRRCSERTFPENFFSKPFVLAVMSLQKEKKKTKGASG